MHERLTPLLQLLVDIENTLDHLEKAVGEYDQSDARNGKQETKTEIKAVVRLPVEVTKYYESEERERPVTSGRDKIRMVLEIFGVAVAMVLAGLTLCTLITLKEQLTEMQLDKRPWVAIDNAGDKGIVPYDPLSVDKGVANFPLRFTLKNGGQSPARVEIGAEIVDIHHDQGETLAKEIERVCTKPPAFSWPAAIVPGTMPYNHIFAFPLNGDTKRVEPTIVGCIWYEATTGDNTLRKAPFSGQITQANDEKGASVEAPKTLPILLRGNFIPMADWKVIDVLMKGTPN
jgi:hypothetical protein